MRRRIATLAILALASAAAAIAAVTVATTATTARARHRPTAAAAPAHPKRGIASARYLEANPGKLAPLGAAWSYDWSASVPPQARSLRWVAMIWGARSVTPRTIARLRAARRAGKVRYLLGFNEPDSAAQANLSPDEAAALWPALERTGLILGSPAPATPTGGWLARFMALARRRHLRVDFIALHFYEDFTTPRAVQDLRRQLRTLHDRYRRPIWITEIGAVDIRAWGEAMSHAPTATAASTYMRTAFEMLDALPFVQRYAWFTDNCWSEAACRYGSLFNGAGRLTPAGALFRTAP